LKNEEEKTASIKIEAVFVSCTRQNIYSVVYPKDTLSKLTTATSPN